MNLHPGFFQHYVLAHENVLTPITYRVVGESHIVLSLDTGRVYGPDLVIILTERSSMCAKGRNPEVPETGSQTSWTEPPAVRKSWMSTQA